jgi:hypothetical protein
MPYLVTKSGEKLHLAGDAPDHAHVVGGIGFFEGFFAIERSPDLDLGKAQGQFGLAIENLGKGARAGSEFVDDR